jgi:hypothetical protein
MNDFREKLEKTLGRKISEDRRPKAGIWYYLWLDPKWELWTYTYTDQDENIAHYEAWQVLADKIATHYKITDKEQIEKLKEAYLGMPRGRVDSADTLGIEAHKGKWMIFHGNDFPLPPKAEIKKLIGIFDLTGLALAGKVEAIEVDHEKMDPNHQATVASVLPYKLLVRPIFL